MFESKEEVEKKQLLLECDSLELVYDEEQGFMPQLQPFCLYLAVSHLYGFGLMDAEAMVIEAEKWTTVPPQHVCVENTDRQIK